MSQRRTLPQETPIISWSSSMENSFVIGTSDLKLFQMRKPSFPQRACGIPKLVNVLTCAKPVRCIDWYKGKDAFHLIAIGDSHGKVSLAVLSEKESHTVAEFTPNSQRPCNSISWSELNHSFLAGGFDKVRSENSISIWDSNYQDTGVQEKPLIELGVGESAMAVSWSPSFPSTLAVGTGFKWLRIYDIRSGASKRRGGLVSVAAHAKAVKGVCFDSLKLHQFATFSEEGQIGIWDIRKMEQPTLRIVSRSKNLSQIAWSPHEENNLTGIASDEKAFITWDIDDVLNGNRNPTEAAEENNTLSISSQASFDTTQPLPNHITSLERRRYTSTNIAGFSWIPSDGFTKRVLLVQQSGKMNTVSLEEPVPLCLSNRGCIGFVESTQVIQKCIDIKQIGWDMYSRAVAGYSLNVVTNISIISKEIQSVSDPEHQSELVCQLEMWKWFNRVAAVDEIETDSSDFGVVTLLTRRSSQDTQILHNRKLPLTSYHSPERNLACLLCGWAELNGKVAGSVPNLAYVYTPSKRVDLTFDTNDAFVIQENNFQRIAALSVFFCRLKNAVAVLQQAAQKLPEHHYRERLELVALAVAGFPTSPILTEGSVLWHDTCLALLEKLDMFPILRAMLAFLIVSFRLHFENHEATVGEGHDTNDGGVSITKLAKPSAHVDELLRSREGIDFACVVFESRFCFADRVALACRFLPDKQLHSFLESKSNQVTSCGMLDGLLLTGIGGPGVKLLQAYVDRCGDLQTVAVIACHAVTTQPSQKRLVSEWLQEYRALLNSWSLWHERARFDVALSRMNEDLDKSHDSAILQGSPYMKPIQDMKTSNNDEVSHDGGNIVRNGDYATHTESQLFVLCPNCLESLALSSFFRGGDQKSGGKKANRRKLALPCCPRCAKRLSSCSVCVLPMTCMNPYALNLGLSRSDQLRVNQLRKSKESTGDRQPLLNGTSHAFGTWFSWCLRCRHGGHASCMHEWFANHYICPVSDCNCKCTSAESTII